MKTRAEVAEWSNAQALRACPTLSGVSSNLTLGGAHVRTSKPPDFFGFFMVGIAYTALCLHVHMRWNRLIRKTSEKEISGFSGWYGIFQHRSVRFFHCPESSPSLARFQAAGTGFSRAWHLRWNTQVWDQPDPAGQKIWRGGAGRAENL